MNESANARLAEKLKDRAAITAAIQRAAREAVLAHARAGRSIPEWRDGKVVWVPPEETLARFSEPLAD